MAAMAAAAAMSMVEAVDGLNTLVDYRYRQHYKAKTGGHGMGRERAAPAGMRWCSRSQSGPRFIDEDNATLIADLAHLGDRVLLARGGNGGFGNAHFKSSTNRAPRRANPGEPGEERWIWLRLKLIADAGLVGLPNAGKSTLLAAVSRGAAEDRRLSLHHPDAPASAWSRSAARSFVMADIPGLIDGAHEGAGLGTRFLGHIERCSVLLHLVDASAEDPVAAYRTIRRELKAYGAALAGKPEFVALNKADPLAPEAMAERSPISASGCARCRW